MVVDDARTALSRLIEERREDYTNLSRVIGRNPAYIQQFVRRGVPKRLSEEDRRRLAAYLRVDESVLGAPAPSAADGVRVPRFAVGASAGPGALPGDERASGHLLFDPRTLRELTGGRGEGLHVIRVTGDSMAPTLADGDDILVDTSDGVERLRDGVYVLRRDDALSVKRLLPSPRPRRVTVASDNPLHTDLPDVPLRDLDIIGRVLWAGRRL